MLRNRMCRIIAIFLILSILIPTTVFASGTLSSAGASSQEMSDEELEIETLLDQRAAVLSEIFSEGSTDTLLSELNAKDLALARLGATFLCIVSKYRSGGAL